MSRGSLLTLGSVRLIAIFGLVALILATAAQRQEPVRSAEQNDSAQNEPEAGGNLVERGRYLAHDVAMCVVCHTPKDSDGRLIESQLLEGSPIPVDNPYPNQPWSLKAPNLTGLPGGWTESAFVEFLSTGRTPTGYTVRPPMPEFRMKNEDAKAVAAYLKSLKANR